MELQQYNIGDLLPQPWRPVMRLFVLLLLGVLPFSAAGVEVLASIRPLAQIARAVTGDAASVRELVPAGSSSHHYQLRPSDRIALARADLVLWVGPAHERFLVKTLATHPRLLTAQRLPGLQLLPQRRPDGDSVLPGTLDDHFWLNPDNAAAIARALAEALAKRDPAHADDFQRNAAGFAERLAAFKTQQASRFRALPRRTYVAYHDAYQYLEPLLLLQYRGSLMASPESKPGARHFLLMSQRLQRERIACFVGDPGFDRALAQQAFHGQPLRTVEVDELFATTALNSRGYEAGLTQAANAFYGCLAGK
jgi:zinc transport system substrate-binding protein